MGDIHQPITGNQVQRILSQAETDQTARPTRVQLPPNQMGVFKVSYGSILSGARRTRLTAFHDPQPAPGVVEGCDLAHRPLRTLRLGLRPFAQDAPLGWLTDFEYTQIRCVAARIVQRWAGPGELATLVKKWYNQPQISGDPVALHATDRASL